MILSERQSYSRSDAASALGCSEATIDRMIRFGQLRSTRIGRRVMIPCREVERILSPNSQDQNASSDSTAFNLQFNQQEVHRS